MDYFTLTSIQLTKQNLHQADQEGNSYKVAFVISHEASEAIFTLVNWWVEGNMLITKVYKSSFESPEEFEEITNSNIAGSCIWELAIISYERNAWVTYVLQNKGSFKSGINNYLEKKYFDYI
ncbi:hypothetical protein ACDX78_22655 [Virgibacillus oceani]